MIQHKNRHAIETKDSYISYEELDLYIEELTISLLDNSNKKRKLVAVYTDNTIESIVMYVTCLKSGYPVMMLGKFSDINYGASVTDAYKPYYIWCKETEVTGYKRLITWKGYALYRIICEVEYKLHDNLALLLSTSGSTGSKKYVRISYDNLKSNTEAIIEALRISKRDKAMVMLPLCYTYGLSIINTYLSVGATLLITDYKVGNKEFWEFFDEHKGTAICGVPLLYDLLRTIHFDWEKHPTLKLATQAGGKLSARTEKYMLEKAFASGFDFAVMYGQTEATARISCHFLNENKAKLGSVGRCIPGGRITNQEGELVYYGENVTMGYASGYEELCLGDMNKGCLKTGDLGYIDEDGFIYITGRTKRIAKLNGIRVSLVELDDAIGEMIDRNIYSVQVRDKIILYIEDDSKEEVRKEMQAQIIESIINFGLSKYDLDIEFIKQLPRDERGKLHFSKEV